MEISSEEGQRRLREMKKESSDNIKKQVNSLKISKFDKDLRQHITSLLRAKTLYQKMMVSKFEKNNRIENVKEEVEALGRIDSRIEYYMGLGQIRKQHRINKLLTFIAIVSVILVCFQLYLQYLVFTGGRN